MEIMKYLKQLISDYSWFGIVPEQARALFTTWCLLNNIEADTFNCDSTLQELYKLGDIESENISYDDFENFMIGLII